MNVTFAPSFVPDPPGRGTLGLVWQCCSTYFLCLWTVIHPNVFDADDLLSRHSKFVWCFIIFFGPEAAILQAVGEYFNSKKLCHHANNGVDGDIERRHSTASRSTPSQHLDHEPLCPVSRGIVGRGPRWGLSHGYLARMGAMEFKFDENPAGLPSCEAIEKLAKCGMLPTVGYLNTQIKALRKSDQRVKTIACIQLLWLVVQTIARKVDGLPVTLLELNTLAQIWITLLIYGLWWYKPQGIEHVTTIDFGACKKCQQQLGANGITLDPRLKPDDWRRIGHYSKSEILIGTVVILFGITVYIVIEFLGWKAYFPTSAEMLVWRVSLCVFVASAGTFLLFQLINLYTTLLERIMDRIQAVVAVGICFVVFARLVLTIEPFVSLRKLPIDAYSTPSWSDMLPHIG